MSGVPGVIPRPTALSPRLSIKPRGAPPASRVDSRTPPAHAPGCERLLGLSRYLENKPNGCKSAIRGLSC
ncbi:MAG: hypothetical protein J07HX5_01513 [halophilic archaeon J07HX5]|nr:MAG: hypothetical protein J07HX5_01513 [halophilic archaeon J07HX5]